MTLRNAFENLATEPKQDTANTLLADILTELGQKLEAGGTVALDVATLLALENINAAVTGTVAVSNPTTDPEVGLAKDATLAAILTELNQKFEAGQAVGLDATTLAALETISVANFPVTQQVAGTVTMTSADLADLLSEFRARYDAVKTASATYSAPGSANLIVPPAGQALRTVWLYAQAKGALDTGFVVVSFSLGTNTYEFELTGSQPFAHSAVWEGPVNGPLVVTTSSAAAVMVNVDYRTFAP